MQLYFQDIHGKAKGRLRQDKQAALKGRRQAAQRQLIRYIEMAGEAKRKLQLTKPRPFLRTY